MREDLQEKIIPAYVSWPTFMRFIDRLKETVTPPRIDNSMMPSFSGGERSQIQVALRFLALIESDGTVTERLRRLVVAYRTEEWKQVLAEVIHTAYAPIVGDLDITIGTAAQLADKFRAIGATGTTVDKCIRFYVSALKEAGTPFSPYFTARRSRTERNGGKLRKITRRTVPEQQSSTTVALLPHESERPHEYAQDPKGTTRLHIPIPGKPMATITVPEDLTEEEWSMLDAFFRSYTKLRDKAKT